MFRTVFELGEGGINIGVMAMCFAVEIVLGLALCLCYKNTSRTTKDFLITLAILPLLVTVVMIMINGSLGTSIAILGAFSLVRFRSMPGSAKELLAVFFDMAIGLAVGMGHLLFAVFFTIIVCLLLFFYDKIKFFDGKGREQILKIVVPEDLDYTGIFDEEFEKYTESHRVMKAKTINMGSLYKVTYIVKMKKNAKEKEFLDAIRVKNCNLQVILSATDDEKEF